MTEYAYRYIDVQYAPPLDEYGDSYGEGRVDVWCQEYRIVKHTPCGIRIDLCDGHTWFVNLKATRKFALPTKEEAWESFVARKKRQRGIYTALIRRIDKALSMKPKELA